MTPSPRCAAFIKGFEQCRHAAYYPTAHDVPTIGWGSTGPDIKLGMIWSQAQCDARFDHDLADFGAEVSAHLTAPTTQGQYDAMVSLAYNIGIGNFETSTLLRLHNAGDTAGTEEQFPRWDKQDGAVLDGLLTRREAEAKIYAS